MRLTALILSVLALCCSVCVCILFMAKQPVRCEITAPGTTTTGFSEAYTRVTPSTSTTIIVTQNGKTTVTTTRTTKRVTIRLKGTNKVVYFTL